MTYDSDFNVVSFPDVTGWRETAEKSGEFWTEEKLKSLWKTVVQDLRERETSAESAAWKQRLTEFHQTIIDEDSAIHGPSRLR